MDSRLVLLRKASKTLFHLLPPSGIESGRDWIEILSALLTPTIAFFGIVIALLQWRINHNRLKHELFDKRFPIYEATRELAMTVMATGRVSDDEAFHFLSRVRESGFLYDDKIKAIELRTIQAEFEPLPVGDERAKLVNKASETRGWFKSQADPMNKKFSKYLKMGGW